MGCSGQTRIDHLRLILNGRRSVETITSDKFIDTVFELRGNLVAEPNVFENVVGENEPTIIHSDKSSQQHNALRAERLQAYRVQRAKHGPSGNAARRIDEILAGHVKQSGLHQPHDNVVPAIASWQTAKYGPSQDRVSLPARMNLGDLAARLCAADDKDGSGGKVAGLTIVGGIELHWPARQRGGGRRSTWAVQATASDNHVFCPPRPLRRHDAKYPVT